MDTSDLIFNPHFLPDEIIAKILGYIISEKGTVFSCRAVCKKWNDILQDLLRMKVNTTPLWMKLRFLELPWFMYYIIFFYNPFKRNLIQSKDSEKFSRCIGKLLGFFIFQYSCC